MILKERYRELVALVNAARPLYMNGQDTGMSDSTYDSYMNDIYEYEAENPPLANSPTRTVNPNLGGDVVHPIPMLSLKDVFTIPDTQEFCDGVVSEEVVEELKIDGLSIQLIYSDGKLVSASTRGDGKIGVEVLQVVNYMDDIPKVISEKRTVIIHGEIFMRKSRFDEYCKRYGAQANPRNTAVGVLKRKDELQRGAYLSFYAFNLDNALGLGILLHTQAIEFVKHLGLPWVPGSIVKDRVKAHVDHENHERDKRDEPIDGLVFKLNDLRTREIRGDNGVIPRWAIAYKFPAQEQETELLGISWEVGATGGITPVAQLKPVVVMGSTISKATLHHKGRVEQLGLMIGDMVTVYKAGDIIPAIKSTRHTESSTPIEFPTECPACHKPLTDDICKNIECREKLLARLNTWTGKKVGNFKGVSVSIVEGLFNRGKIRVPADFYAVKGIDIMTLPGSGKAKVSTYLKCLDVSKKNMTLAQVIVGLGINNLAEAGANSLADYLINHFGGDSWKNAIIGILSIPDAVLCSILGDAKGSSVASQLQNPFIANVVRTTAEIFKDRIV